MLDQVYMCQLRPDRTKHITRIQTSSQTDLWCVDFLSIYSEICLKTTVMSQLHNYVL